MYYYTIGQYLEHIVDELEAELRSEENVAGIKERLSGKCTRTQALLYFLKYHYGYAFEYEYIYTNHIIKNFKGERMNVLSLGCANGIDLWSLCHALSHSSTDIGSIGYKGIDNCTYGEVFSGRQADEVSYHRGRELKNKSSVEDTDVLFLPRSAGRLRRGELDRLAIRMGRNGKRLYIAASFGSGDKLDADINNFDYLIDRLEKAGMRIREGGRNRYYKYNDEEVCGIKSIYHDYEYPDRALALLGKLRTAVSDDVGMPVLTNGMLRYNYAVMDSLYS